MGQDEQTRVDARWKDQAFLVDEQYRDSSNLAARANLHAKYGRGDWFEWLAAQFRWPANAEVLEMGCGPGTFWNAARNALPPSLRLTLTDLSPGMVREAMARVATNWPTATGQVADASALPFGDETFDVVVANHMMYHVLPEPACGLREMHRVLRPGATALVATNGRHSMRTLLELRSSLDVPGGDAALGALFSLENAEPMLRALFESVELRRYPDELRCTDPEDIVAYLTSSPPGSDATEAQIANLRAAVAAAFRRGGGILTIEKDSGLFICRKRGPHPLL